MNLLFFSEDNVLSDEIKYAIFPNIKVTKIEPLLLDWVYYVYIGGDLLRNDSNSIPSYHYAGKCM